jgi:hypothetical protein
MTSNAGAGAAEGGRMKTSASAPPRERPLAPGRCMQILSPHFLAEFAGPIVHQNSTIVFS